MGRIERRVLAAALLGAVAMFGVVGFARGEGTATPALGVPVAVEGTSFMVVVLLPLLVLADSH